MIKKINTRVVVNCEKSIFYNPKEDIQTLSFICRALTDKVNELIKVVNYLEDENKKLVEHNKKITEVEIQREKEASYQKFLKEATDNAN